MRLDHFPCRTLRIQSFGPLYTSPQASPPQNSYNRTRRGADLGFRVYNNATEKVDCLQEVCNATWEYNIWEVGRADKLELPHRWLRTSQLTVYMHVYGVTTLKDS